MPIKNFHDKWTQNICEHLEKSKKVYIEHFHNKYGEETVDDNDWAYFLEFLNFLNCSTTLCDKNNDLPIPEQELVPSLTWMRFILFPDDYPHPDEDPDEDSFELG
ncbi:hypothetical protein Q4555_07930 [Octadecabacter sp. 1_MG-2023]|uniref:hypothetical protein n=1 Tax=unclassified Octadecabacter TaxID=196158 RepID=UPI001C09864B|nr:MULTISPECIES: hypothetical protein [unclassified Octadecabacter]MBU2994117.1 hypothetical protein [Octadecabacter sp. B2R22]MDO6734594.1 hypothetical protein [Octadecabacter sp. 1_MG-2023]